MKLGPEAIGTLAAISTTLCWVPQALKIIRERRTEGISLITQSIFTFGVALWAIYGILLKNGPLLLANVTTLLLSSAILVLTALARRSPNPVAKGKSKLADSVADPVSDYEARIRSAGAR